MQGLFAGVPPNSNIAVTINNNNNNNHHGDISNNDYRTQTIGDNADNRSILRELREIGKDTNQRVRKANDNLEALSTAKKQRAVPTKVTGLGKVRDNLFSAPTCPEVLRQHFSSPSLRGHEDEGADSSPLLRGEGGHGDEGEDSSPSLRGEGGGEDEHSDENTVYYSPNMTDRQSHTTDGPSSVTSKNDKEEYTNRRIGRGRDPSNEYNGTTERIATQSGPYCIAMMVLPEQCVFQSTRPKRKELGKSAVSVPWCSRPSM